MSSGVQGHPGSPPSFSIPAPIYYCDPSPHPSSLSPLASLQHAHSCPQLMLPPCWADCPPPQLPQSLQTFANEVQLGLLLPGPFELELLVIAVEFLSSEGDQEGGFRSGISRISTSPRFHTHNTLDLESWTRPRPQTQCSPRAHQPRQAQITGDRQNDNPTGCDKIAKGTFRQLRATWGGGCQRSETGPLASPHNNNQGDRQTDGKTYWRWRRSWPQRQRSLPGPDHS